MIMIGGCAQSSVNMGGKTVKIVQKSHSKRPQWTIHPPEDTKRFYYSVGVKTGALTLEGGETDARMDAGRKFIERLFGIETSAEYEKVRKSYQTEIMEELKGKSKGKIAGARVKEIYWEKLEITEGSLVKYRYNIWILLEISKKETKRVLKERLEKRERIVAFTKRFLHNFEKTIAKKGDVRILSALENLRKSLGEYDDPEINELKREVNSKLLELRRKTRRVGIAITSKETNLHNLSAEMVKLFTENGYYAVEIPFNDKNKILSQSEKLGLRYLIYGEINVHITGRKRGFFLARSKGTLSMFHIPSGDTIISIPVNERGAGKEKERAITNALSLSIRKIKQELNRKIKELP